MNISAILCADWAKEQRKRAVFVADIGARTVSRIARADWSVAKVLDAAQPWAERGPVLVAFDAPLGVPASYLEARFEKSSVGKPRNGKGGLTSYVRAAKAVGVDLYRAIDRQTNTGHSPPRCSPRAANN